eukprot:15343132-Ditylum_brightwellii.AAC.1
MKIQCTVDQSIDTTLEDVHLPTKSDDELSDCGSSSSHEGNNKAGPNQKKKKNGCNVKTNKVVRASCPSSKDSEGKLPHHTILDYGTEWTIVGSPA